MAIFEFSEDGSIYHGVFFAEVDKQGVLNMMNDTTMKLPDDYVVGFMGIVWTDPNGELILKSRIVFPNGNKQAYEKNLGKQGTILEAILIFKKFPLIYDTWIPNPSGTLMGLMHKINEANMIEKLTLMKIEDLQD